MDLPGLAVILQAALSTNPDERKAAEHSLNQVRRICFVGDVLIIVLGCWYGIFDRDCVFGDWVLS